MKKLFLLLIIFLLTSCVEEVVRPKLVGMVLDEAGKPIPQVMVGETFTDENGKFELPEETQYGAFSIFGRKPVFIREEIKKEGYESKVLSGGNTRGGIWPGQIWDMDTIRLRKNISTFSQVKLKEIWLASMTKNFDTVFMTKKIAQNIEGKIDFIANKCNTYSRGYYYGIDNLPKNVFERHIEMNLQNPVLKIQKILIHGDPVTSEKTKYDTIYSKGKWKVENKTLNFQTDLPELNGTYKVVDFNYDSMQLLKQ